MPDIIGTAATGGRQDSGLLRLKAGDSTTFFCSHRGDGFSFNLITAAEKRREDEIKGSST